MFFIFPLFFIFFIQFQLVFAHEPDIKCNTFPILHNKELHEKILSGVQLDPLTGRPKNQVTVHSSSGRFAVHFDTIGKNKVPLKDINLNNVPDYIDSVLYYLEYCYNFFVDTLGFSSPPIDSGRGGSDAYDFYLWDIGNGAAEEVAYGWTNLDLNIKVFGIFEKYACYSIIDNDYSPFDTTFFPNGTKRQTYRESGYQGMKITVAHELHHLFQFGYGDPLFPSFNEMTSTFMEWRVFPETKDYLQFVKSLFSSFSKYLLSNPTYNVGYRYAIFLQYIYLKFGDKPIVELWENIGKGNNALLSLELALRSVGSSMPEALANFLPYIYYSGDKTRENSLPNSNLFPQISFQFEKKFEKDEITTRYLRPYEIMPIRFFMPSENPSILWDTLSIFLANLDTYSAVNQKLDSTLECSIILSTNALESSIQLYPRNIFYKFNGDKSLIADSLFFDLGFKTFVTIAPFPNPWKYKKEGISFPIPDNVPIKEKVEFWLFDSNMNEISLSKKEIETSLVGTIRALHLEKIPEIQSSGVYFYKIKFKDKEIFGKFIAIE